MSTSNGSILAPESAAPDRVPLRLRMADHPGSSRLDGGWWPQSRDLALELADLVDHFPPRLGRVVRALFSPPDWDPAPRRIPVATGYVKVGSFPRDDTHLILLKTSDRTELRVLVVPSDLTQGQGEEALLAAATAGNPRSAADVLHHAIDHPDRSPMDHWSDDGGSWREPLAAARTSRAGR
jgi:hypothetical protein